MKNNLHTVATRSFLALNCRSEGYKHNLEIPAETEFSDLLRPTAGKRRLLFKFSYPVTQNGALQAQRHNKIKSHQNPCCNAPDTPVATSGPLPSTTETKIQTEFRMRNLNKISSPTSPTAAKQKTPFQFWLLRWRVFFLNNWRKGKSHNIWNYGITVNTWHVCQGGHKGREDTGPKQVIPEPSQCKHGSIFRLRRRTECSWARAKVYRNLQ
jgi:hypothetical protein